MMAGSSEHDNEHSGSIKCGEFLDYLSDYQLLKEDSATRNCFLADEFLVLPVILLHPQHLLVVTEPQQMIVKTSVKSKGSIHYVEQHWVCTILLFHLTSRF
jgi:hypothetical protein